MAKKILRFKMMYRDGKIPGTKILMPDQAIRMPKGAQLLRSDFYGYSEGQLFFWALIETQNDDCFRRFGVYKSDEALPLDPGVFVSTALSKHEILHIFDLGEVPV